MKQLLLFLTAFVFTACQAIAQDEASELVKKVKAKLEKVNDYQASGKMKTNVTFIKAPIASVKVYYKKPDKLRINQIVIHQQRRCQGYKERRQKRGPLILTNQNRQLEYKPSQQAGQDGLKDQHAQPPTKCIGRSDKHK